jgi:hypothetical protein
MFKRIYARAVEIGNPITPGQMAILMRAHDHEIGIAACKELIEIAKQHDQLIKEANAYDAKM